MKGLLDAKNDDYVARAREVAEKYIRPVAAELDEKEEYPWSVMAKLQEYGLTGVWIPKEYGGKGDGVLNLCLVVHFLSPVMTYESPSLTARQERLPASLPAFFSERA